MKKSLQQNAEEDDNSTDKKYMKNKLDERQSTHNKVIAKIIKQKSSIWSNIKTMLKRGTCLVMILGLLLLMFMCFTEAKKGPKVIKKTKLSEEELDRAAEKLAKQMSKESRKEDELESEERESKESESDEKEEEEIEYIEGTSLRKPPKANKKRAEKRAKEFLKMHNDDGSIAAAWERLTDAVKGDEDMLGLAKEIKKTYKITEDAPQGERMEKMMTMLQEKNINKIADSIGNKFSGDGKVQKVLKTIQNGFKEKSKTKKDEKKPKGTKDNATSKKNVKPDKKENSEKKHTKVNKDEKVKSTKTDKNGKENKKNSIKNESKSKTGTSQEMKATTPDRTTEYNNQKPVTSEDKKIKSPSCENDQTKTNENSHVYKKAQSECNVPVNENIDPVTDDKENIKSFSRFQDSVNFDTKQVVMDSGNQKRGEMGENLTPIHNKQSRGDAGDTLSPLSNSPTPSKQKRGDTGETLSLNINTPSPGEERPSERTHLPSAIPSSQDQGDGSFNSIPGRGSLPEKVPGIKNDEEKILGDKQRAKNKEKHWTGQGYDFGKKEPEPMGPPSEKDEGNIGKLTKVPLFGLLSSRDDRTKGNTKKKAKVSRQAARGDTGSIDNMMESLQDHGGWKVVERGRNY